MSDVTIVLDPGSTHMGKQAYGMELIDIAEEAGALIKFQLFPNAKEYTDSGNVHLKMDLFQSLYNYGKKKGTLITASVFGDKELEYLAGFDVPFVKFSHSKREWLTKIKGCLGFGVKVVVSTDCSSDRLLPRHNNLVKLFCIPEYPHTDFICFDGLFPRFDGFSDHTLGYEQTLNAVKAGANWIEKHITLDYDDVDCPDRGFALTRKEAVAMCNEIRKVR
jgi:N,N'-diacetyllegionaminate synthase